MFKCLESTGTIFSTEKEKKYLLDLPLLLYFSKLNVRNEGLKEKRQEGRAARNRREWREYERGNGWELRVGKWMKLKS